MSYQVIARKWRPQKFDEVVYQEHITRTLRNSIKNGRISHAYLFSGPRGVGKTTLARILAMALNCKGGPSDEPCGKCENCLEIRNGTSFDVIEIDGASNNSVDDVRELRENINFAPVKSKYRVYIIDEVHMLSLSAFNALLKTLEEPPPHVVFIFATTEYHKIPETILSRCQKYFFKKIPVEALVGQLKHIAAAEGFRIEDRALYPIARAAEGSMRDAQSLMDQVVSFSEGEIKEEDALSILGVVPLESYLRLLECIRALDAAGVIGEADRVITLGVDIPRYAAGFLDTLRAVRLVGAGISVREILGFSGEEVDRLRKAAGNFTDEELGLLFGIGGDLLDDMRYASGERIILEMALLDMIAVKRRPSLAAILKKLQDAAGGKGSGPSGPPDRAGTAVKKENPGAAPRKNSPLVEEMAKSQPGEKEPAPVAQGASRGIKEHWVDLLASIQKEKSYLFFKLKAARIEFKESALSILYPRGSENSYYSRILDRKDLAFLKEELTRRMGKGVAVGVGAYASPGENNGAGGGDAPPPPEAEMMKNPEAEEWDQPNPAVEKIKDLFHGQIIKKGEE